MTEPKVEAGDRALETAREIVHYFLEPDSESRIEHHIPPIADLIQSAMNAQERELREALRGILEWELDYRTRNHLGKTPPHPFVQAERLLAERGEGR